MHRLSRLIWITVLVLAPACRDDNGLGRVEVRGRVTYQGAPLQRGLITFRPASGSRGPAAGTGIVDGKFLIPAEQGPIAGPHEVEVKIVIVDNDLVKSGEPVLLKRSPGKLKSFAQRVEVTKGVNEFEFSFPNSQPAADKHALP
ncbi:MAG TPA: hypothetical protein VGM76_10225 [Lacipirellulaceae bacterium]|jgi:hypothetical protein